MIAGSESIFPKPGVACANSVTSAVLITKDDRLGANSSFPKEIPVDSPINGNNSITTIPESVHAPELAVLQVGKPSAETLPEDLSPSSPQPAVKPASAMVFGLCAPGVSSTIPTDPNEYAKWRHEFSEAVWAFHGGDSDSELDLSTLEDDKASEPWTSVSRSDRPRWREENIRPYYGRSDESPRMVRYLRRKERRIRRMLNSTPNFDDDLPTQAYVRELRVSDLENGGIERFFGVNWTLPDQ